MEYAWPWLQKHLRLLETNYSVSPYTYARWGDWNPAYPQPRTPEVPQGTPFTRTVSHITGAAMVVQNHIEFAEMAAVLGKEEDAARWSAMVPELRRQYHESFYDPESASYGTGNPTSFACALWLEVTPPELLPRVVDNFVKVLHSANYRMTSMGFIGVRYVFEALTKVNRTDVALRMLHSREYPSFGWCMTNNFTGDQATSLWESYDAPTMHQWLDESSRDHHYSASINTALRKDLAGLDMPTGSNAWSTVKCRPEAAHWPHLLPSASATLHSRRGTVACSWSATSPVSPAPPPAMLDAPTVQCAISKIWTGAISLLPSFPPCLSACTCPRWVLAACTGP